MQSQCPWYIACPLYVLIYVIVGMIIQATIMRRGWRPTYLAYLLVPSVIGAGLITLWDFIVKPALL